MDVNSGVHGSGPSGTENDGLLIPRLGDEAGVWARTAPNAMSKMRRLFHT